MVAVAELPAWQDAEKMPIGRLLKWADKHADPDVRDQPARTRAAVAGLRKRYAADQKLTAITSESERLEARLAELAPAKRSCWR